MLADYRLRVAGVLRDWGLPSGQARAWLPVLSGSLSAGMSGGPALDQDGQVIGVNVARRVDGEQVSFLVPADFVAALLARGRDSAPLKTPAYAELGAQLQAHQAELTDRFIAQGWKPDTHPRYRVPVPQDDDTFRLSRPDGGDFLLQARLDGQWVNQYGFDLSPQEWVDFEPANHLNATHPGAIFVQKRVLVRHHPAGRDILLGDQLKTFHHGVVHTRAVPPEELPGVLKERFGLAVPA